MTTASSFNQSHETAQKVVEYLGLTEENIGNKYHASLYINYSHNGKTFELRISDHVANPKRTEAKKVILGYTPVELGNNWEIAKRTIDREVFGKFEVIERGAEVNHPTYGIGIAIAHNVEKDKLDVDFNGVVKSFFATTIIDRGWVKVII